MSLRAFCLTCGHTIDVKHGTAEENECAKCGAEMAPLTNKLVRLKPINIFRTGTWKGFPYTIKHLDEMVQNFKDGIIRAYIKVTNDNEHGRVGDRPLLSSLAMGWVDSLKRDGERLYASFKQVPEAIAKLITGGGLKQKSIELWPRFKTTDGKERGAALEAILFFGTGLPAVHDLEEAAELFQEVKSDCEKHTIAVEKMTSHDPGDGGTGDTNNNRDPAAGRSRHSAAGKKSNPQELKVEIDPKEFQVLVADQAKLKVSQDEASTHKAHAEKLQASLTEAEGKVETLTKDRDKAVKAVEDSKKSTVEAFVATVVKGGKLEPARKDAVVSEIAKMTDEQAEDYRKRLESLPSLFKTDEVETTKPGDEDGASDDLDSEKRDKAIKAAMKADKTLSYTAADEKLFGGGSGRLV